MNHAEFDKYMNDLIDKTRESFKELTDKLENSGAIDIDGAEVNYRLPKNIMTALCLKMAAEWSPNKKNRKDWKEIKNIQLFLQFFTRKII